jgi:uncharacterized protein YeaO (DUF488 family)
VIQTKRIYDEPNKNDGFKVLVDRLWPRGLNKDKAKVDLWLKDIAPSNELRKWFSHDPAKWLEFKIRYKKELKDKQELIEQLCEELKKGKVTLLFAAKDTKHNNAVVLKEVLEAVSGKQKLR